MLGLRACLFADYTLAANALYKQVRWDDQSQYPEVTIESFVGQSSMGLLCPPADFTAETSKPASLETGVAHTHTHNRLYRYAVFSVGQIFSDCVMASCVGGNW